MARTAVRGRIWFKRSAIMGRRIRSHGRVSDGIARPLHDGQAKWSLKQRRKHDEGRIRQAIWHGPRRTAEAGGRGTRTSPLGPIRADFSLQFTSKEAYGSICRRSSINSFGGPMTDRGVMSNVSPLTVEEFLSEDQKTTISLAHTRCGLYAAHLQLHMGALALPGGRPNRPEPGHVRRHAADGIGPDTRGRRFFRTGEQSRLYVDGRLQSTSPTRMDLSDLTFGIVPDTVRCLASAEDRPFQEPA